MTEPERTSKGDLRYYDFGTDAYPSVTTVLNEYAPKKKAIQKFMATTDNPKQVRDRAGLVGTLAHHRILNRYAIRELEPPKIDLSLVDDTLEEDIQTCEALWEMADIDIGPSPHVEEKTWSHEHEYAGTADLFTNGCVYDLKTSRGVYDSHKLQAAAYFYALREMPSMPDPDRAAIVWLHPDPERNEEMAPEIHRLAESRLSGLFDEFLRVREKFERQQRIGDP